MDGMDGIRVVVCIEHLTELIILSGEAFEDPGSEIATTCMCGKKGLSVEDLPDPFHADFTPNIVGGINTAENEFPWQVGIQTNTWFEGGGTLITPSHVLTANHVVMNSNGNPWPATDVKALLGSHSRSRTVAFPVRRIFHHPSYTTVSNGRFQWATFDFAILELETPVPFDHTMLPACLPGPQTLPSDFVGEKVIVTGWGLIEYSEEGDGAAVDKLLKTPYPQNSLIAISQIDCQNLYASIMEMDESMMCTGLNEQIDACTLDSGGPMVVQADNQNWTLVREARTLDVY